MQALNNLDCCYENGIQTDTFVLPQDYKKAASYYDRAASQGDAVACVNLGCLYEKGLGVEQDMGKAARLYRKAARQGDAEAYFCLGCLYEKHYHDVSEAIRWYRQAARAGHEKAEECLRLLAGQNPAEDSAL